MDIILKENEIPSDLLKYFEPVAEGDKTDVWTFPTQNYSGAHFATFSEKLPELCIRAATPEVGCCSKCGAPWARIIGNPKRVTSGGYGSKTADECKLSPTSSIRTKTWTVKETLGWQPSCGHKAYKIRDDLTAEELAFVEKEMAKQ